MSYLNRAKYIPFRYALHAYPDLRVQYLKRIPSRAADYTVWLCATKRLYVTVTMEVIVAIKALFLTFFGGRK